MLPSLIDRLGDAKDSVREQDQALLLKIMDQAANPQVSPGCSCEVSVGFGETIYGISSGPSYPPPPVEYLQRVYL